MYNLRSSTRVKYTSYIPYEMRRPIPDIGSTETAVLGLLDALTIMSRDREARARSGEGKAMFGCLDARMQPHVNVDLEKLQTIIGSSVWTSSMIYSGTYTNKITKWLSDKGPVFIFASTDAELGVILTEAESWTLSVEIKGYWESCDDNVTGEPSKPESSSLDEVDIAASITSNLQHAITVRKYMPEAVYAAYISDTRGNPLELQIETLGNLRGILAITPVYYRNSDGAIACNKYPNGDQDILLVKNNYVMSVAYGKFPSNTQKMELAFVMGKNIDDIVDICACTFYKGFNPIALYDISFI